MIKEYDKGKCVKLSEHFDSTDFDCHCSRKDCLVTYVDTELIDFLENRLLLWHVIPEIVSGFRCTVHNRSVGGAAGSRHLTGQAADIRVKGLPPYKIANDCENIGGLGRYKTFTHIDTRHKKARWTGC